MCKRAEYLNVMLVGNCLIITEFNTKDTIIAQEWSEI